MKKSTVLKIIFIIACIAFFVICIMSAEPYQPNDECKKYIDLEHVTGNVYVDKNTEILYFYRNAYTPIFTEDGTPLLYSEVNKNQ